MNKNIFPILLGILSIWLLWPILRWALGVVFLLLSGIFLYFWWKSYQAKRILENNQHTASAGYSTRKNSDVIDVEFTERRVEDDAL